MIKHEIKITFSNVDELKQIIQKAYFEEGDRGKLLGRKNYIKINDDINYAIFKGLHNITINIINEELIDGSMRFVVEEKDNEIRLYPISIYAIQEEEKYIFY